MTMYSQAVEAIRGVVTTRQQHLDAMEASTRAEFQAAFLVALRVCVPEGTAARCVADLLAHETIFTERGERPSASLSEEGRAVLRAARAAGIVPFDGQVGNVRWAGDGSGHVSNYGDDTNERYHEACHAYDRAREYRRANEQADKL